MTVLYSDRDIPLAIKASNPFSAAIDLAYDFTQHDAAHANGVPWKYVGVTVPTLPISGSMTLTTVNGEPGRLAGTASVYDYTNLTNYGLQVGTGDFTIGLRLAIPAVTATVDSSMELMRIAGSAGTTVSLSKIESATLGVYFSISGTLGFGAVQTATFYPANTTVMVWLTRFGGQTSFYTQNVTAGTNVVARTLPAASAIDLDATRAARLMLNFRSSVQNTTPLVAFTHWSTGFSAADLSAIGKDMYDLWENEAVADAITLDVPANDAVLASSFVASGTYTGAVPSSVQIQHGAGAWTTGTSATITAGAWSATFTLAAAAANTLQVRNGGNTATVSNVRTGVVIASDSLSFTAPSTQQSAVDHRIFQRDALNQAVVRLSGTFTGTAAALEYRWGSTGAWTNLVTAPAGNAFDTTVTLTGPDQQDLTVRITDKPAVFGTLLNIGVGDVYLAAGQSNHVGGGAGTYVPAEAPPAHLNWVASIYDKTGRWRVNVETSTDPFSKTTNASIYPAASAVYPVQAASATAYNSYFGQFATRYMAGGVPVAVVPCALGSTAIASWAPTSSTAQLYGAMVAVATTIGAHKGVLWWQGEADCGNGSTRASYTTALNALLNDWATRFTTKFTIMNLNQTGTSAGTGGTGSTDTGYNAIHAAITDVAATNPNVVGYADMNGAFSSSIHYATAPEIAEVSRRAYEAMSGDLPTVTRRTTPLLALMCN